VGAIRSSYLTHHSLAHYCQAIVTLTLLLIWQCQSTERWFKCYH